LALVLHVLQRYLMLAALVSSVALAESVWEDDGSLTIIDSSELSNIYIDSSGSIKTETALSGNETTFVYGADKLTVCQPTAQGVICY